MVPAAYVGRHVAELAPLLRSRRHHRRRRQLVLPRRHRPVVPARRAGHSLRRRRHERRRVRPGAGLLPHDRWRRRAVERLDPSSTRWRPGCRRRERTPGPRGEPTADEHGYLHCGPSGAGHFVKMVHNGIEYGMMAAYAEGLNVLEGASGARRRAHDAETAPLRGAAVLPVRAGPGGRRRGLAAGQRRRLVAARPHRHGAGSTTRRLDGVRRPVGDSGEGRWTVTQRSTRACRSTSSRRCSVGSVTRGGRVREQAPVGDALRLRRAPGEERDVVHSMAPVGM